MSRNGVLYPIAERIFNHVDAKAMMMTDELKVRYPDIDSSTRVVKSILNIIKTGNKDKPFIYLQPITVESKAGYVSGLFAYDPDMNVLYKKDAERA